LNFLIISRYFPPPVKDGMTRYAESLAKGLQKAGHRIIVLTGSLEENNNRLTFKDRNGIRVYKHISVENLKLKKESWVNLSKIIKRIVKKHEINHIIIQHPYHAHAAINVKKLMRIPVHYVCHTASLVEIKAREIEPGINRDIMNEEQELYAFKKSNSVICVSKILCRNLKILYNLKNKNIFYVPTGIKILKPIKSQKVKEIIDNIPKNRKIIIYVGRDSWEKGTDLLPGIIEKTTSITQIPFFVIVGIHRKNWSSFIYSKQTILLPWLTQNELNYLFSRCHILVLPSRRDSMPYVLLEGMGNSVVPIVTNNDGPGELIIHNHNGLKVSYKFVKGKIQIDPTEFARKIDILIKNNHLYNKLSCNAFRTISHNFTINKNIHEFLKVINS
jgi:glycosyltransferase involved in cell wall biosynthesis